MSDELARVARPAAIVGRDAELVRIAAFADALSGGAGALVFRGDPGIGKTALWRHAVDRYRASGLRVLVSRPAEEEMPLALSGLLDLFEHVDLDVAALRAEANPIVRGRVVLEALRELAVQGPTVIGVDDVQWLDPGSARALRFALRRLDEEPVGLLASVRPGAHPDDPLASVWPLSSTRLEVVDLGPLGMEDLRRVLGGTVKAISRPTLRRIHEVSGGNPLYAIELARGVSHHDTSPSAGGLPLPDSLQGAIAGRLEGVPPELAPLLETVSALGRTSVRELRELVPETEVEPLLATAEAHALLVVEEDLGVRFTHPLFGSGVYGAMSPMARRSMHARLADRAADPDVRARHLALSTLAVDVGVAAELESAAERANGRGDFDLAADFASHSLRLTPRDDLESVQRRAFLEINGRAHGGEASEAVALADRLISLLPHGRRRAEALLRRSYLSDEDMDTDERMLLEALEEAGADEALRGNILDQLGWARGMFRGDLRGGLRYSEEAAAIAERTRDAELQMLSGARAILHSLAGSRQPDRLARGVELEAEYGKPSLWDSPRALLGEDLLWAGELPPARALFEAVYADAVRSGEEGLRPYCLYDLALAECSSGNLAEAEALAREGIEASRDAEDSWGEILLLHPLALALAWEGRAEEAREAASQRLEGATRRGERPGIARARSVLGLLALSEGDAAGAARELGAAVTLLDEMGMANPGAIPALPDAVEALAHAGETDQAEALLGRLEEQAVAVDGPWPRSAADRARGVLLLTRGDADEACRPLERAAESFDRLGYLPDAARAGLAHGRALLRTGQRSLAHAVLADARGRFADMGARLWEARASEDLARAAGERSEAVLTPTERRIAQLVADGMRNRQIGDALFVEVATVEAHLTRIYRKLDIRSRSDLARLVADGTVDVGPSNPS